jgi:membrane-associated phospholipid phosphatase
MNTMNRLNIMNIISGSIGLVFIIPFVLYYITGNSIHFKAFLGVSGTTILSESIKYIFIGKLSPRPKGATNCDLLCADGNQEGKPGMPSSHSAEVAFFSAFYFQQTTNPIIKSILIIYALFVMLSRYIKKCHSINQISVGAILGVSMSWILVRQL